MAERYILVHRTPVCRQKPTHIMKKKAYGVEVVELEFQEMEVLQLFKAQGFEFIEQIEISADPAADSYTISYLLQRR